MLLLLLWQSTQKEATSCHLNVFSVAVKRPRKSSGRDKGFLLAHASGLQVSHSGEVKAVGAWNMAIRCLQPQEESHECVHVSAGFAFLHPYSTFQDSKPRECVVHTGRGASLFNVIEIIPWRRAPYLSLIFIISDFVKVTRLTVTGRKGLSGLQLFWGCNLSRRGRHFRRSQSLSALPTGSRIWAGSDTVL